MFPLLHSSPPTDTHTKEKREKMFLDTKFASLFFFISLLLIYDDKLIKHDDEVVKQGPIKGDWDLITEGLRLWV